MTAGAHDPVTRGNIADQWEKCSRVRVGRRGGVLATEINMSWLRTLTAFVMSVDEVQCAVVGY